MLEQYLTNNGVKCLYKHIFDSVAGALFIHNSFSNTVEIFILCATRQSFFDEVLKSAGDFDVLIIDRLFLSILAIQGQSEKDAKFIYSAMDYMDYKSEDFVIYFMETDPDVCKNRLYNKNSHDRIEEKSVEFHRNVFQRYKSLLLNEKNVNIFQGCDTINNIHNEIVDKTIQLLKNK